MSAPVLEVNNLGKRFGAIQGLADISFSLSAGEIVGVIGPNGAGKTTLLECLAALLAPDGGSVRWQGAELQADRTKEVMFYLPDGILPYGALPVAAVLGFYREMFGAPAAREREVVKQLSLSGVAKQRVQELSKGFRRRLLLAIALLTHHPLVLLDEPFDGFDLRQSLNIIPILREFAHGERALLLCIHQLSDAARICDRFLLLAEGRLLGQGTLADLQRQSGAKSADLEEVFLALT